MSSQNVRQITSELPFHSALSGEADHRIANSLAVIGSLVRLRASDGNAAGNPRRFLTEIAERIDAVAKLHRLVAQSPSGTVQLDAYLHEICDGLVNALAPDATAVSLNCSPEQTAPFNIALPLGLIAAELFSNSLKYAHPTGLPVKVTVSTRETGAGGLTFIYEDDGVGFPEGFDPSRDGDMGMHFIRSLSQQLNGTHKWLSDELGIRFEIVVPLTLQ